MGRPALANGWLPGQHAGQTFAVRLMKTYISQIGKWPA
jgi:hypothetical protein